MKHIKIATPMGFQRRGNTLFYKYEAPPGLYINAPPLNLTRKKQLHKSCIRLTSSLNTFFDTMITE
ncbi:hypothetical protein [Flavobacterium sp. T12S277]|uniref:hypothetical protein n=1 Tax=Flavobacterium sp. T12S277 TaxID=3402752 RepID=UPI003ADF0355